MTSIQFRRPLFAMYLRRPEVMIQRRRLITAREVVGAMHVLIDCLLS